MALDIADGYTLDGRTLPDFAEARGLPVVAYRYRPALPEALSAWRYALRVADCGKAELDATAKLVADHLVGWDVTASGRSAPVTAENVKKLPEPILDQVVKAIITWPALSEREDHAGNSSAGASSS